MMHVVGPNLGARAGDVLTLVVEFSERVQRLDVWLLGMLVASDASGRYLEFVWTVGKDDPPGSVTVNSSTFYDFAQFPHPVSGFNRTTDGSYVIVDHTPPARLRLPQIAIYTSFCAVLNAVSPLRGCGRAYYTRLLRKMREIKYGLRLTMCLISPFSSGHAASRGGVAQPAALARQAG